MSISRFFSAFNRNLTDNFFLSLQNVCFLWYLFTSAIKDVSESVVFENMSHCPLVTGNDTESTYRLVAVLKGMLQACVPFKCQQAVSSQHLMEI